MISRFLLTQPLIFLLALLWEGWQFRDHPLSLVSWQTRFAILSHVGLPLVYSSLPFHSHSSLAGSLPARDNSHFSSPRLLCEEVLMGAFKPFPCACCVLCLYHESVGGDAALLKSRGSHWPALAEALAVVNEQLWEADPRCGGWSWGRRYTVSY